MFLNASLLFFGSGPEGCYGWSGNCLIQQSLALMSPRTVDDHSILELADFISEFHNGEGPKLQLLECAMPPPPPPPHPNPFHDV